MGDVQQTVGGILRRLEQAAEEARTAPAPTPSVGHADLCIAMATYDDFDGAWFTAVSTLVHHREVADRISFLLLDNHPTGEAARYLKRMESLPRFRYLPFDGYRGTAVRDLLFREADADVVCCLDSHVLLAPGSLVALLEYFDQRPGCMDLVQGVLTQRGGTRAMATHMIPEWGQSMFGKWALDERALAAGEPFDIEMHGLGFFACRKEAWPGFNPRLRGFGAEEGYLHEKIRRAGGRTVCHPGILWAHRFERPGGIPYPMAYEERLRNYRITFDELGWDLDGLEQHYRAMANDNMFSYVAERIDRQLTSPFIGIDGLFAVRPPEMSRLDAVSSFDQFDVLWRVEIIDPEVDDGDDGDERWEAAIAEATRRAAQRGYRSALVLEPEATVENPRQQLARATGCPRADLVTTGGADGYGPRATYLTIEASSISLIGGGSTAQHDHDPDGVIGPILPIVVPSLEVVAPPADRRRRAIVAVLRPREHLPFITEWCQHHLDQGWAVYLLDNTGSIGSVRRTSAHRYDLADQRRQEGRSLPFEHYLDDVDEAGIAALMRAELAPLDGVTVLDWQPRLETGEVIHGQAEAYARFCEQYRGLIDWAAFIDPDEYLVVAPGFDWDDLIERAERSDCPRIVLKGIVYESRWTDDGVPLERAGLGVCGLQTGRWKNVVRLDQATRVDVHYMWQFGDKRHMARPDPVLFGLHHYNGRRPDGLLNVTDQPARTFLDESVGVIPDDADVAVADA
ncbi:MAG: hypothetical protein ACK5OX_03660 [Desertimonas sp.]